MNTAGSSLRAPIFVVGHPRSGTSLLAAMLGRHPQVLALPETHFFNEARYALKPNYSRGAEAVATRLETTRMRHLPLSRLDIRSALAHAEMTPKGVLDTLLSTVLKKSGKVRLVEKTPVHIRHVNDILLMWPDAQIVWIVRDGRAAISSLRKLNWASNDLAVLARQWTRNMRFGIAAQTATPMQVTRLSYEKLIDNPMDAMLKVCNRTGLRFFPDMLDHTRPTQTVSSFERAWKANVQAPLNPRRATAWKDELRPHEIGALEEIMAPVLIELGYHVGRPVSFRAILEQLRDNAANNALGRKVQMLLYDVVADRRFAPDGANQANAKQR